MFDLTIVLRSCEESDVSIDGKDLAPLLDFMLANQNHAVDVSSPFTLILLGIGGEKLVFRCL